MTTELNNSEDEEKFYTEIGENKINVFFIKVVINNTIHKYIKLICKKEKIENSKNREKLSILGDYGSQFDIKLSEKDNYIISTDKITFVRLHEDNICFDSFKDDKRYSEFIKNEEIKRKFFYYFKIIIIVGLVLLSPNIYLICFKLNNDNIVSEKTDYSNYGFKVEDMERKYQKGEKITIKYANGNIQYIGPLKDFNAEGRGKYYSKDYNNIIIYDGKFKEGYADGKGTMYYYEGKKNIGNYTGLWKGSKRNGMGEMYNFTNGSIYNGLWADDKRNGKGELNFSNGGFYEGEFKDDKWNGKGKLNYSNGDYYDGYFVDDKKEGNGTYIYKDRDCYEGSFKNDQRHGQGRIYSPSEKKESCKGEFINDKFQLSLWKRLKSLFHSEPHC